MTARADDRFALGVINVVKWLVADAALRLRRFVDIIRVFGMLAGVVLVMDVQVLNSSSGDDFLILIVAATVLGGIGSAYGAMVGSVIIGVCSKSDGASTLLTLGALISNGLSGHC